MESVQETILSYVENTGNFYCNKRAAVAALVLVGAVGVFYKFCKKQKIAMLQANSDFKIDHPVNDKLNEFEDNSGCEIAYKKIPNKIDTFQWTDMKKPIVRIAHTSDRNSLLQLVERLRFILLHGIKQILMKNYNMILINQKFQKKHLLNPP